MPEPAPLPPTGVGIRASRRRGVRTGWAFGGASWPRSVARAQCAPALAARAKPCAAAIGHPLRWACCQAVSPEIGTSTAVAVSAPRWSKARKSFMSEGCHAVAARATFCHPEQARAQADPRRPPWYRDRMATPESPKKRGGELTMWAMVLAAAATVVGIALFKEQKSAPSSPLSAPAISLQLLEGGRSVPLPKGKVTLVDFWATWCAPCRASMPRVQSLWHEYSGRGMELYSVNTDDESPERKSKVEEFLQQNGLSFQRRSNMARPWAVILGASSGFGAAAGAELARTGFDIFGVHLDRRGTQ